MLYPSSPLGRLGDPMKDILDQMEEHIAAIRNLQRNFDFHSKRLERLMKSLNERHPENNSDENSDKPQSQEMG
jgi:hypothetical protein